MIDFVMAREWIKLDADQEVRASDLEPASARAAFAARCPMLSAVACCLALAGGVFGGAAGRAGGEGAGGELRRVCAA